jgi:dihydroorotase-like cyclic amidohydrolase
LLAGTQALHLYGTVLAGGSVADVFRGGGPCHLAPGLVDAHVHLSLSSPAGPDR